MKAHRQWGERRGKLLRRRLDGLAAAVNLETMRQLPAARCHELTGNQKGKLAFVRHHDFAAASVARFAADLKIAPGIVVGSLQHDGAIQFNRLNDLKRRFT